MRLANQNPGFNYSATSEQVTAQAALVRVRFQDQARFGRSSDPRRGCAPAGMRPEVSSPAVREYEYAFAAIRPHDGTLVSLVLPAVPAEARSVFRAAVSQRPAGEFIVRVLDGAGWHQAKRLLESCRYVSRICSLGPSRALHNLWSPMRLRLRRPTHVLHAMSDPIETAQAVLECGAGLLTSGLLSLSVVTEMVRRSEDPR
jgi:hypothetical protein